MVNFKLSYFIIEMLYQLYIESSWGVAHLLGKDRRVFFTSLRKKYYLVDRFPLLVRIVVVFPNSFPRLLCFCHKVAFLLSCAWHLERENCDVPDLWSFLTSGVIFFNIVVGKLAVTCQKIKQPIFHHKLNKHWKISILQGPLAYISL